MDSPASVWEDPQCAFRVEWEPEKLDQVRIAVVDAFYALPRGGLEIGGVLLGSFDGKVLRITDTAVLDCEHLTGPTFALSERDESVLEQQLGSLGTQVVGWYRSNTRSDIQFTPKDRAVHNRFFPKPWHVGLVLRPIHVQPLRANYFFRDENGAIASGSEQFTVDVLRAAPEKHAPRSEPVVLAPPREIPEPRPKPVVVPQAAPVEIPLRPEPISEQKPIRGPALSITRAEFEEPEPKKRRFLWIAAAVTIAALGGSAYLARDLWLPGKPATLGLRAADVDGNLIVRWNNVRNASTAALHIDDGGKATDVTLDGQQLSHGIYAHVRQATKATVRLKMGALEQTIDYEGPLPKPPEPDTAALKAKEEAERRGKKMRADLTNEYERGRQYQGRSNERKAAKAKPKKKKR